MVPGMYEVFACVRVGTRSLSVVSDSLQLHEL